MQVIISSKKYFFQLTVGVIGQKETVFDKPMTPGEIQSVMYSTIQPYDIIGAVLQQVLNLHFLLFQQNHFTMLSVTFAMTLGALIEQSKKTICYLTKVNIIGSTIKQLSYTPHDIFNHCSHSICSALALISIRQMIIAQHEIDRN